MYSAKEAAKMTGLSTATLRYYEKEIALTQSKLLFYQELLKDPLNKNITYSEEWQLFKNERNTKG